MVNTTPWCEAFRGHHSAPVLPPAACGAQAPPRTPTSVASHSLYVCAGPPAESLELFSQAKVPVTPTLPIGTGSSRTWRPEVAREDVGPTEPGPGPKLLLNLPFASFLLQIPSIMPPGWPLSCHIISTSAHRLSISKGKASCRSGPRPWANAFFFTFNSKIQAECPPPRPPQEQLLTAHGQRPRFHSNSKEPDTR